MRLFRVALVALVAAPFAVAATGGTAAAPGACTAPAASLRSALPAPVSVRTRCGVFELARDGHVRLLTHDTSPVTKGALEYWPYTGVWDAKSAGHLVVGRWHRTLWHSHARFTSRHALYDLSIVVGSTALTYSTGFPHPRLYVAPLDGRERLVARGEVPIGWTRGGFYTWGRADHRLSLRGTDGAFRKTIAPSVFTYAYAEHGLWLIMGGWLLRAEGSHVRRVAALRPLLLWPVRHLQLLPLGRLLGLETSRRLVVLRADGSVFASTDLTYGTREADGVSASPVENRQGSLVAFATSRGDAGYTSRGSETIWVLQTHDRGARPVRVERGLRWPTCVSGATLSWRGGWLLYSSNGGRVALVDWRSGQQVDLTSLLRQLPGARASDGGLDASVSWG
jgi:hypothetical protein